METVNLVVGDWSADGHGMTDTITIESSLTREQMKAAYDAACEKIGLDLCGAVASDYEDSQISLSDIEKLVANGVPYAAFFDSFSYAPTDEDIQSLKEESESEGQLYLSSDSFTHVYLEMVKVGNPAFTYTIIKSPTINIGGYGLFSL